MAGYSIVLGVAAVTTFLLTFIVRKVAVRIGAVSHPGPRSVHAKATPSLGGAAMFAAFLAAMAVASQIPQFHAMFHNSSEPVGLMLAAAVIFVVGAVDDLREVSPPAKVAGMVLAGGILSLFGVSMLYFRVPFASYDYVVLSADLAPLVTVVTVVLMANALNLIDGLDGLAAGIVAIAGAGLFLYSDRLFKAGLLEGSNIAPLIAVIAVGVCIGFLPHNFNPARIFMGDAGAMFLGLLMAAMTITVGGRTGDQFSGQTYFFFAPLFIPLLILGVPIVDTAFSFFRRVARRQAFHVADKDHLHHRLMRLGHGPRRTVVILWLWTALLSGMVLIPTYTNHGNALVPVGVAALGLLLYVYFHPGRRSDHPSLDVPEQAPEEVDAAAAATADDAVVDFEARRRAAGRGSS
jgi:UDP-GlcNAc:undecaprenyl-phosphate/decaprenyl-phosphate GlcNAc-1-phosphate transferase